MEIQSNFSLLVLFRRISFISYYCQHTGWQWIPFIKGLLAFDNRYYSDMHTTIDKGITMSSIRTDVARLNLMERVHNSLRYCDCFELLVECPWQNVPGFWSSEKMYSRFRPWKNVPQSKCPLEMVRRVKCPLSSIGKIQIKWDWRLDDVVIQAYIDRHLSCLNRGFIYEWKQWSKNKSKLLHYDYLCLFDIYW